MKQLEIIRLRLTREHSDQLIEDIRRSAAASRGKETIRIYRQAVVVGDIGPRLLVEAGDGDARPSDLGIRLDSALRDHGMVEHTVWIEDAGDASPAGREQ